jgi:hypothetical protein
VVFVKEPEGPWTCDQCGQEGRINANGTHDCFNQSCLNFPYITDANREKWMKRFNDAIQKFAPEG